MKTILILKISAITIIPILLLIGCKPSTANIAEIESDNHGEFTNLKERWSSLEKDEKNNIRDFIFDDYFKDIEGADYVEHDSGDPIFGMEAEEITDYYCDEFGQPGDEKRDKLTKSVYFRASQIVDFVRTLESSCPNPKVLGLRFYFAKYKTDNGDLKVKDHHTLILRGVCNYEDIPHTSNETASGLRVAMNYGDVCPPVCKLPNDKTVECIKGEYKKDGKNDASCN